jgi:dihydroorotase
MMSREKLWILGGHVVDPATGLDEAADVFIADGRVVSVGIRPDGFSADRVLDAAGKVVCPGLVDLAAHLREPGQEHKATIASEAAAAASAGITALCCPPDTDPVIETPADVELILQRTEHVGKVRVLPLGALTHALAGEALSEMVALKEAGCVGLSNGQRPIDNALVARRIMEYAATHGITVHLFSEDYWLRDHGCAHEGRVSTRLGLPGIPEAAETVAVARDLELVEQTGVRAHFCRLSTARAAEKIARARRGGLPVTADVSAHQLHLTEDDIGDFDAMCHLIPPLRTEQDRDALRAALADGTLSAICSDHQPHEADAKLAPFPSTEPGISALETLLPLALVLVRDGVLPLREAVARMTSGPAQILGIAAGSLETGAIADICIFDPDRNWTLSAQSMVSRGRNTPFLGHEFPGRVTHTFLGGRCVYELDENRRG